MLADLADTVRKEVQDSLRQDYDDKLLEAQERFDNERYELQRLVDAFKAKMQTATPQPAGLATPFLPQPKDAQYAQVLRQAAQNKSMATAPSGLASSSASPADFAKAITDSLKAATGKSSVTDPAKWCCRQPLLAGVAYPC